MQSPDLPTTQMPRCADKDPCPLAPSLAIPAGAVDCHAHIFGPVSHYPYHPDRTYTPPDSSLASFQHLHRTLGIERGVLVQPSVYGCDNSATYDALQALKTSGADYRGVAVVKPDVKDDTLDVLQAAGVRGVRLNLLFKGGLAWRDLRALAGRLADRNWHLQLLIDVSAMDDLTTRLAGLPVPVVIDHMGHMPAAKGPDHEGFTALCRLLGEGSAWVKLSGAYRMTARRRLPYDDVIPLARRLVDANPARCVWGSDWPHPHFSGEMPNDGPLLDELAQWAPDPETRRRILVDNPTVLYFTP